MQETNGNVWFPEPQSEDDSWARDRESSCEWLTRSTKPRAREMRRFLNQNLASLPVTVQPSFAHALHHRWESALFEMVVTRLLQEWGAQTEIEKPNQEGRCPDILAHFETTDVVIEATCPLYNRAMSAELSDKNPLVRLIESLAPEGYSVGVWDLPRLSGSQSRKELKRTIQQLFETFAHFPAEQMPLDGIELSTEIEQGEVRLRLFPPHIIKSEETRSEKRALFGPMISGMDDSVSRIAAAVKAKRSQVRACEYPVVLAIHGGNLGSSLEDFDQALIGSSWERIEFVGGSSYPVERGFDCDGALYRRPQNEKPPTYAGVLALLDVGVLGIKSWAFYPHPRFKGILPAPLTDLPQRTFDAATQAIVSTNGNSPSDMNLRLKVVSSNV